MADALQLYTSSISKYTVPTREEEYALALRKDTDPRAFEELYVRNLRFVVAVVRGMTSNENDILDYISVGNEGLRRAIAKFDPERGSKLSTYASWWIKQQVLRNIPSNRLVRIPIYAFTENAKLNRISEKMSEELGRPPTADEIHEETGVSLSKIRRWQDAAMPTSLDAPISDADGSGTIGDVIADSSAQSASNEVEAGDSFTNVIEAMKARLSDQQYNILMRRFGLKKGDKGETLEEIAVDYGVTRERIRQIQKAALKLVKKELEHRENVLTKHTKLKAGVVGKLDRNDFQTEGVKTRTGSTFCASMEAEKGTGARLREERLRLGYPSARKFAADKGLSLANYCNAEVRPHIVSASFMSRVAAVIGVSYNWLTTGEGQKHAPGQLNEGTVKKGGIGGPPKSLRPEPPRAQHPAGANVGKLSDMSLPELTAEYEQLKSDIAALEKRRADLRVRITSLLD
jgi:RNA polymerase primary sigma factor